MSSNQVVQYVYQHQLIDIPDDATPERVVQAIKNCLYEIDRTHLIAQRCTRWFNNRLCILLTAIINPIPNL